MTRATQLREPVIIGLSNVDVSDDGQVRAVGALRLAGQLDIATCCGSIGSPTA